jgi:hypothetical protein
MAVKMVVLVETVVYCVLRRAAGLGQGQQQMYRFV